MQHAPPVFQHVRFPPLLAHGLNLLAAAALVWVASTAAAQAAPVWVQSDDLLGELAGPYTASISGNAVTVTYLSQTVTNSGAGGDYAMYFGWNWVRPDATGAYQPLAWDNTTQTFANGNVAMQVERLGAPAEFLRLGDVQADSWVGVPWTFDPAVTAIATQADWVAPLFDFGFIGAGQSLDYDIRFSFTFASAAAAQTFLDLGAFGSYAQGLVAAETPEPMSLGLVALALALVVVSSPRPRRAPDITV